MDPLTQGALGSAAAQAVMGRRLPRSAWLIGWAAGMAADLDVFIRPASDPLMGWSYHRHFTHALAFIPIGAAIAALPFLLVPALRHYRRDVFVTALIAYATHGLLDACTTFGTVLYWPFSDVRVAWSFIGIIDPFFTLTLAIGIGWSVRRQRRRPACIALVIAGLYMGIGAIQHHRAIGIQHALAAQRGHTIVRGAVLPTPANLILWRSVYQTGRMLQCDTLRLPFLADATVRPGPTGEVAAIERYEHKGSLSAQARDAYARFAWFADGYIAPDARDERVIADARYIMEPDRFAGLWGLLIPSTDDANETARLIRFERSPGVTWLWDALLGRDLAFRPLPAGQDKHQRNELTFPAE